MIDPSAEKRLLSIKELSARSGLSISTLRRLVRQRLIPYYQPAGPGGVLRFPRDAIERACAAADDRAPIPPAEASKPLPGRRPKWRG